MKTLYISKLLVMLQGVEVVVFDLDYTLSCPNTERLYTGVRRLLDKLRENNIKIALASYNAYADEVLMSNNVLHYFSYIAFENWKMQSKLDMKERMLKEILKHLNCSPSKVLFVDDQRPNIKTAIKLGIKTLHIPKEKLVETFDNALKVEAVESLQKGATKKPNKQIEITNQVEIK